VERRLTTILAADVVGYSRLMEEDEARTFERLKTLRKELVQPSITAHKGRIFKLIGDGLLAEFPSVVEAVQCAIDIQQSMRAWEADSPEGSRLQLRIGINLGDIIVEGSDIYGDGVNLAARLEGHANPGGICVSEAVAAQATGKIPIGFVDEGERHLKNIAAPIRIYSIDLDNKGITPRQNSRRRYVLAAMAVTLVIAALGVAWGIASRTESMDDLQFSEAIALARPSGPTIAVMPFENLSGDSSRDYLAEGISEDIIVELGRFPDLNVLSPSPIPQSQDGVTDPREIGRQLNADYILQGTVRESNDRLRVTARLSEVSWGKLAWSGTYDEPLTASDLFDVQHRITARVASAVRNVDGAIKRIDERRARTKPPEQLSSYECSMLRIGFEYDDSIQDRIRGCILRVVENEPDYWRGWAQLSDALRTDVMIFGNRYEGTHAEKLNRSLAAAKKAVSLNPDAPRTHYVLATVLLMLGDRESFFAAAEDALALGGDRLVEGHIGFWFIWTGRHELGAALLNKAIDLDPNKARDSWHRGLANYQFLNGNYEEALREYIKGAQPEFWWSVAEEVAILTKLGRKQEARAALDRLYELRPGIKIADIVWVFRRFQKPDADSAKFVDAYREIGIPEGRYRPLEVEGA
jgi:class 3 adenylate cyclase/TolB-like protein/tetratricopeptide (TPR) repeat protein